MTLRQARVALRRAADPARAEVLRTYVKTGPGEYGEGDRFIGVTVPTITRIARRYRGLSRPDLGRLLRSRVNEERAMALTICAIKQGRFGPTLRLCRLLLRDRHDLIHKACGWMLLEVGKRNADVLERFLRVHRARMPRTMLRYAIERFPPALRRAHLAGTPSIARGRPRRRARSATTTS